MENKVIKEMERALVKHFLDTVVLANLRDSGRLSGYDVIELVHKKFDILASSGTVYALLYSLERKGLITGEFADAKRVYILTDKGKENIAEISRSKEEILRFIGMLLEG